MKYIATDGTVFTNRNEYRKYEMETQYTFREQHNTSLTKLPGTVSGQPFNIIKCQNSTLVVLDHCDQVQIDDVQSSKIFIGASSESVFIRDCNDCTFTIACKQLRTRDCKNCTIYLYCKTEPIIESSTQMKFGPFNGAYPGHEEAMKEANLNPNHNKWYEVYDFNDDLKLNHNWSYVKVDEEDETWCPIGQAENCCPKVRIGEEPIMENRKTIKMSNLGKKVCTDARVITIQEVQKGSQMPSNPVAHGNNTKNQTGEDKASQMRDKSIQGRELILLKYIKDNAYIPNLIKIVVSSAVDHTSKFVTSVKESIQSFSRWIGLTQDC